MSLDCKKSYLPLLLWIRIYLFSRDSFQISILVWTSRATTLRCVKRSRPRTLGACALKTVRRTRSQFARPMEQRMITSASLKEKCVIWRRILHFTILVVALVSGAHSIFGHRNWPLCLFSWSRNTDYLRLWTEEKELVIILFLIKPF